METKFDLFNAANRKFVCSSLTVNGIVVTMTFQQSYLAIRTNDLLPQFNQKYLLEFSIQSSCYKVLNIQRLTMKNISTGFELEAALNFAKLIMAFKCRHFPIKIRLRRVWNFLYKVPL